MRHAHGDHGAVHVDHRVTLSRSRAGLFHVARAAPAVLLAERLTLRALALHDVALVIDRAAVFAPTGMRRCLALRDRHVGTLAVVAGGDATFTFLQVRLVRRLRLRSRSHDEPEQRHRQHEPRHDSTSLYLLTSRTIGRSLGPGRPRIKMSATWNFAGMKGNGSRWRLSGTSVTPHPEVR